MAKSKYVDYILSLKSGDVVFSKRLDRYFSSLKTIYNKNLKTEVGFFINQKGETEKITKVIIL